MMDFFVGALSAFGGVLIAFVLAGIYLIFQSLPEIEDPGGVALFIIAALAFGAACVWVRG